MVATTRAGEPAGKKARLQGSKGQQQQQEHEAGVEAEGLGKTGGGGEAQGEMEAVRGLTPEERVAAERKMEKAAAAAAATASWQRAAGVTRWGGPRHHQPAVGPPAGRLHGEPFDPHAGQPVVLPLGAGCP